MAGRRLPVPRHCARPLFRRGARPVRPDRHGDPAAVHLRHGPGVGVFVPARHVRRHHDQRQRHRDPDRRAGGRGGAGHRARRLPDGEARRSRPRVRRRLHLLGDRRRARRPVHGPLGADRAAAGAVVRQAGVLHAGAARPHHGRLAERPLRPQGHDGRGPGPSPFADRLRRADRDPALLAQHDVSARRPAAGAGGARAVLASRTGGARRLQPLDLRRAARQDFRRHHGWREGLLHPLVAAAALVS